jgi:hypothetical protein
MKTLFKLAFFIITISIVVSSCSKKKTVTPVGPLGANYPYALNTIITPAILDSLEKDGTVINSGLTPPSINGTYLLSPDSCTFDDSGEELANTLFDNYDYEFADQNTAQYTVKVSYVDIGDTDDTGSDNSATYIAGTGSLFTVFAQATGTDEGIPYVSLQVVSGSITTGGIKNFQLSTYLVSKTGDASNSVIEPVGSIRIFLAEDGLAAIQTSSAVTPNKIQAHLSKQLRSLLSVVKSHINK